MNVQQAQAIARACVRQALSLGSYSHPLDALETIRRVCGLGDLDCRKVHRELYKQRSQLPYYIKREYEP